MLWQMHWQYRNGRTEMKAQRDLDESDIQEMRRFVKEIAEDYPLPDKAMWLIVNEKSKHFVKELG